MAVIECSFLFLLSSTFSSPLHLTPPPPPPFLSLSKPSLFILCFQHPLSALALSPLLSLPSALLRLCLIGVKYRPFTHLHLIFPPSTSYLHLISHTSDGGQVSPLNLVHVSFFLHSFVRRPSPSSVSLNEPFSVCQSSASPSMFVWTCERGKEGKDGDGLVGVGGSEGLEREE